MLLLYKTQKRGQWLTVRERAKEWLAERGKLPADTLGQFRTKDNALSVYELDADRHNAPRILAAILSTKDAQGGIISTDCLIFKSSLIDSVGITIKDEPGLTPDTVANTWHRDLSGISAEQLLALSEALVNEAEMVSFLEDELVIALKSAHRAGNVQKNLLNTKALGHVEAA